MFFKDREKKNEYSYLAKVGALLIHAAKIDENYSPIEEEIIKKTLLDLDVSEEDLELVLADAKKIEEKSNQILDFTKVVKNMDENEKIKIIESLWRIIYSNKNADMYETNLMRRLAGLLYIDSKTMGDIKNRVKEES